EVVILDINRNRLPVIIRKGVLNTERIQFLFSDEVDGVVSSNPEEPCTEGKILLESMQASERFREGFDRQVFGIVDITNPLEAHVIHRPLAALRRLHIRYNGPADRVGDQAQVVTSRNRKSPYQFLHPILLVVSAAHPVTR